MSCKTGDIRFEYQFQKVHEPGFEDKYPRRWPATKTAAYPNKSSFDAQSVMRNSYSVLCAHVLLRNNELRITHYVNAFSASVIQTLKMEISCLRMLVCSSNNDKARFISATLSTFF